MAGAAICVTGTVINTTVRVAGKMVEKSIDVATPNGKPAPRSYITRP